MSFVNTPKPLHREGDFKVSIPGMSDLWFDKCDELKATIAEIKRTMGGMVHETKRVGNVSFANIKLEWGSTSDQRPYDWFTLCQDAIAERGAVDSDYLKEVSITQYDSTKVTVLERILLHNAFPVEYGSGGFDAENKNFRVKNMTLAFEVGEQIG